MSSDLVAYIRKQKEWCSRLMSGGDWFAIDPDDAPFRAADRIEALEGERDLIKEAYTRLSRDHEEITAIITKQRGAAEARAERLRVALTRLRDCDWVITLPDRMDAVREIARKALEDDKQ